MNNTSTTKVILDNGLTVILKEMHHAPVICFMVWYRVGSRQERPGITGVSHWVEHMMFKGSPLFPGGELDRLISREGGYWNAFTWLDYTAYIETMPAERIALALQLEADRMAYALMNPADVESERMVILSERAMYENEPEFLLNEALISAAFTTHPYRHEVIGSEDDLRSMGQEDLLAHYSRYYVPNNAVIVAVGDFESGGFLQKIKEQFGSIPAGPSLESLALEEAPQNGERRVVVTGPGETPFLTVAYRAPAGNHPDYYPLAVLNAALAGGSSLGSFSGGGSNRTSRLYKAMVESEVAAGVGGSFGPTMDPFLYTLNVIVHPGSTLPEAEAALDEELKRLHSEPISQKELDKALKRAKVQFAMAGESISGQANLLGMAEVTMGDFRWYDQILEKLNTVTIGDLERVRGTYLRPENRVVGWYQPMEEQWAPPGD